MEHQENTKKYKTLEEYEREGKELTACELRKLDGDLEKNRFKLHTYYATMYGYSAEENLIYSLFSSLTMLCILLAALFTIPWVSNTVDSKDVLDFYNDHAHYTLMYALKNLLRPLSLILSVFTFTVLFFAIKVIEVSAQKTGHSYIYPMKAVFNYIFPIFVMTTVGLFTFSFITFVGCGFDMEKTGESLLFVTKYLLDSAFAKDVFVGAYAVPSIIFGALGIESETSVSMLSFMLLVYLFTCFLKNFSRAFTENPLDKIFVLVASAVVALTAIIECVAPFNFSSLGSFLFYPFIIVGMETAYNGISFWTNFKSYKIYNSRDLDNEDKDDETIDTNVPYDGEEFYAPEEEDEQDIIA